MSHGFACHVQNVKKGGVSGRAVHSLRLCEVHSNENIDKAFDYLNYTFREPGEGMTVYQECAIDIEERVIAQGNRVRSDSNWLAEMTVTIPVGMDLTHSQALTYFSTCRDELNKMVGAENERLCVCHFDEIGGQPHMHYMFQPITAEGRLSSKEVVTRVFLNQLHDKLPKALQEKGFDVVRGETTRGKNVHSKSVREFKRDSEKENQRLKAENALLKAEIADLRQEKKDLEVLLQGGKETLEALNTQIDAEMGRYGEACCQTMEQLLDVETLQDKAEELSDGIDVLAEGLETLELIKAQAERLQEVRKAKNSVRMTLDEIERFTKKYYSSHDDEDYDYDDER